jgi:uncharacterized membrane protein HdeD (DUF308 family)
MSTLAVFLSGVATTSFVLAGLFFFRFWRRTRDRLFIAFGIAFWLMALNQGLIVLSNIPREEQSWLYLLRVGAFGLLIVAIVAKNFRPGASKSP